MGGCSTDAAGDAPSRLDGTSTCGPLNTSFRTKTGAAVEKSKCSGIHSLEELARPSPADSANQHGCRSFPEENQLEVCVSGPVDEFATSLAP
eukprot:scaffold1026_cov272-Pinguiococcus_pyrenoidosus.AAC.2